MPVIDAPRRSISSRRLAWLETESQHWQDDRRDRRAGTPGHPRSLYDRIERTPRNAGADPASPSGCAASACCFSSGTSGTQIPRAGKLAIVIGSVVAAFGASAFAYAKQRLIAAETLALFGVLLFGNAIWLRRTGTCISTDTIRMRSSGGELGEIACAWLTRSKWIGVLAAGVLLVWIGAEGDAQPGACAGLPHWSGRSRLRRA